MPKDTFFNLEEGKRLKIIKAAKAEFLNNPLRKVKQNLKLKIELIKC